MSVEERKALTLFKEHLKRYPDDPNNENVEKVVETLEKLKKRILVQQQVDMAEEAIEKGEGNPKSRQFPGGSSWLSHVLP